MTRLVRFGLGEIVDRLTILALKLQHGVGDKQTFEAERRDLISMIAPQTAATIPEWADLANVNNQLWQAEDKMREYRGRKLRLTTHDHFDISELGMQCQALNDDRSQLIASINLSQGDGHAEKGTGTTDSLP